MLADFASNKLLSQKKLAPLSRGRGSANIKSGRYRYVQLVPHVAAESTVPVVPYDSGTLLKGSPAAEHAVLTIYREECM